MSVWRDEYITLFNDLAGRRPYIHRSRMSQYEPRFTIEQIDLLQRLRHTGMRRDAAAPRLAAATPCPPPPAAPAAAALNGRDGLRNGKLSPPRFPPGPARTYAYEVVDELEIGDKVEELMRRDSSLIKEEIKVFLGNRRISQAVVAQVTGISQSRISHWLLQQGSDLSEQKKRAFYRWYQLEKTSPGNAPPHPRQGPALSPPLQALFSCSTRSIHY
ncbi:hypothetical protein AAFF_G00398180 [Aldrovandia affinis]|uniref:Uncharacterized protein n=1 Tax=Aldrovandia affinis TaxID=143900 RepID=A0AAD7R3Y8_9TELE|nr:hypothetical protein AAFF_G00398180 [Aldrovandia affinis]